MASNDEKPVSGEKSPPADKLMASRPHNQRHIVISWSILHAFKFFLAMVKPDLLVAMDPQRPPNIVTEKHLLPIGQNTDKGSRIADVVATAYMEGGREHPIIVLVEQQDYKDSSFDLRVFQSAINLQASYPDRDVTALAIVTSEVNTDGFHSKTCYDTTISVKFNTFHLSDNLIEELRKDPRLFARIFHAILVSKGKKVQEAELNAMQVLEDMKLNGYDKKQRNFIIQFVNDIFNFDGNIDNLSTEFKKEFYMEYYSSVEEIDQAYKLRLACEEARDKARLDLIRKMLEKKVPMATIIDVTEWTKEDILAVAKEMENPRD
jgi:RNA processing factor Prp31